MKGWTKVKGAVEFPILGDVALTNDVAFADRVSKHSRSETQSSNMVLGQEQIKYTELLYRGLSLFLADRHG